MPDQSPDTLTATECMALANCLNHMVSQTETDEFSTLVGIDKESAKALMTKLKSMTAD
ncbi:hypothetical protein [Phaeobacter porticola]|uniref:MarR family transcriptional regulator n=1 Tax=Phaeobacter porticola TaxID=1844006 RepID=A0A1L3I026_9RHOB|nr:hypothetical protein [Phaeobacter porticola]APG45480.1 hypothetical protein PhaeoP97_00022 [Phaeobacter porticola]